VPSAAAGYAHENRDNRYALRLPGDLSGAPVRVEHDGQAVSFELEGAKAPAKIKCSRARYAEALPSVAVAYTAEADTVKEELVLASAQAPSEYRFRLGLSAGLTPKENADGGLDIVGADGQVEFSVAAPFAYDAAGSAESADRQGPGDDEPCPGGVGLGGHASRRPVVAAGRRPRVPVTVDPTVRIGSPQDDCFISGASQTTVHCAQELELGWEAGHEDRALLRLPSPAHCPRGRRCTARSSRSTPTAAPPRRRSR
jgi:hypothetical protein